MIVVSPAPNRRTTLAANSVQKRPSTNSFVTSDLWELVPRQPNHFFARRACRQIDAPTRGRTSSISLTRMDRTQSRRPPLQGQARQFLSSWSFLDPLGTLPCRTASPCQDACQTSSYSSGGSIKSEGIAESSPFAYSHASTVSILY